MKSFFLRRNDSQAGHSKSASKEPSASWTTSEYRTSRPDKRDDASRSHKLSEKPRSSSRAPRPTQTPVLDPSYSSRGYSSSNNRNVVSSSANPSASGSKPIVPPPSTRANPIKLPPSLDAPQTRTTSAVRPSTEIRKVSTGTYPTSTTQQTSNASANSVITPVHQVWHPPQTSTSASLRPKEKEAESDGDRVRTREREYRARDRERERGKDREREKTRDKERERDLDREKDRAKGRDSDREKDRDRSRYKDREKDSDGEKERQREKELEQRERIRLRTERNVERADLAAKERLNHNEWELEQGRLKTQELLKFREKQIRDKANRTKEQEIPGERQKDRTKYMSDRDGEHFVDMDKSLPRYRRTDSERTNEVIRDYAPLQRSNGKDSSDEGDSSDASRHKHGLGHRRNKAKEVIPPISSTQLGSISLPFQAPVFPLETSSLPNPSHFLDPQSPAPLPVHLPIKPSETKPQQEVVSSQTPIVNGLPYSVDSKTVRRNYRDLETGAMQSQSQRKLIPDESRPTKNQPLSTQQGTSIAAGVKNTANEHSQNSVISTTDPNYRATGRVDFRRGEMSFAGKFSAAPVFNNSTQDSNSLPFASGIRDRIAMNNSGSNSTTLVQELSTGRADFRRGETTSAGPPTRYSTVPQSTSVSQDISSKTLPSYASDRKVSGGLGQSVNPTAVDPTYRSASRADYRRGDTSSSIKPSIFQSGVATQDTSSSLLFAPMPREKNVAGTLGQNAAVSTNDPDYRSAIRADVRRNETTVNVKPSLPQSSSGTQDVPSQPYIPTNQDRATSTQTAAAPVAVDPTYRSASRAGFRRTEVATTKSSMPQTSSATQDPSSSLLFAPVLQDKSIGGITTTQSTMDPSYRSASRVDFRRGESSSALKTSVPQPASGVQATLIFAPTPREKNTTGNNGQIATAPSGTEPTYRSASRADFRKGEKSLPSKTTTGPQILETSDPSPITVGAVSSYAPYDSASRLIGSQQGSFSENPPATSISQKMVRDNETKARNGTDSPYSQLKKDEKSSPVSNIMLSNKPQISPSWPNRMPESVPQQGYNMHVTPPTPVKRTPSGDQNGQPLADSLRYNIESPLNSFKNANTAGTTRRSGDPNENMRPQITSGDNSTRPVDRSSVNPLPEYPQESFAQRSVPIKASQHKAEHEARTSPSHPIQSMVDPANSGIKFPAREDRGANYSTGTPKQSSPQFNVSLTSNGRGRVVSISASNDGSPLNRIVSEVTAGSNNPSPRRVSEHVGYSPSARPPMIGGRSLSTDSGTAALARPEVSHFSTSKNAPPSGSSPGSRRVEPDRHLQTVPPGTNANADNAYPTAPSHSTQYPNNVSMTQQSGPPYGGMVSSAKPHGFSSASTQAQSSLSQQQQAFNGILSTKPHNLSSVSAQVHPSVPQQQLGQSSNGTANPKSYSFSSASAHAYPNTQNSGPINSGSAALRAGFSSASAQAYPAISQHTGQVNVGTDARSYPNMSSASAQAYPATAQHAGQVNINTDVRPHLGMSSASGQLNMYQQAGNPGTTSGKPQTVQPTPMPTTGRHMADPSRERLNQNSAMSAIANPYRHPKLAELLSDEPQRPSHADAPYTEYQNAQAGISQGIPQQSSGHPSFQPSPVSRAISAAVKTPSDEVDSQLPGGNPPSAAGFYGSFSSRYSPPKYNSTVSTSSRRQHDASQKDHAMASSTLKSNDFRTMSTQPPPSNPITLPTTSDLQRGMANVNVSENFVSSHQQTPFERPPSSRPNDYSYKPADNPIVSTSTSVNGRVRSSAQPALSSYSRDQPSFPSYQQQPHSQSNTPSSSNSQSLQNGYLAGRHSREPSLDTSQQTSSPHTPSMSKPNSSQTSIPVSTASQQESRKKGLFGIFKSRTQSQESQHEARTPAKPQPPSRPTDHYGIPLKGDYSQPADRERKRSKAKIPPPINVPIAVATVSNGRKSPSKVFTPFRYMSAKRNRTVSAASVEAVNGTAPNTVVGSPTASMHSSQPPPFQPPQLRDPQLATQEWQQRRYEIEGRSQGNKRVQRPGVVFDVPQEPSEDKQNLKYVKNRIRSSR